jgi:phosphoglucosamine mutase
MGMERLFGTDGVRGIANLEPMTAEKALEIGRAVAYVCKRHRDHRHSVVIGKDTRVSGYMLESALTAGICSMGVDVHLVGPLPTPGIAYLTHSMRADAGVVISASHNPYQDNGIKIFSLSGFKLPDAEEDEIEDLVTSGRICDIRPTADEIGKAHRIDDAIGRYVVFAKNTFPDELSLEGLKIVLDCANGATYKAAPMIFAELGADVTAIHVEPDGVNINDGCGSQHTEDLRAKVLELGADVGLAFDGDGDRLIAIDEKGQELTGDHVMVICADRLKRQGKLRKNLVISTVMSNFGFGLALKELGIDYAASKVGDRYVLEMMQERGAILGGEASGHTILLDRHTTGDGIVTALHVLAAMRDSGKKLSELARMMALFPQQIVNVDVTRKPPLEELADVQAAVAAAEAELGDRGRVLVRYSGTQSMCRVMVEGPTEEATRRLATSIAEAVRAGIG